MNKMNHIVEDSIPTYFRKEAYQACYEPIIYPTNGQNMWQSTQFSDILPPPLKRPPGRPKRSRNKDADEKLKEGTRKMSRRGWVNKCSKCGQPGHKKGSCKGPSGSQQAQTQAQQQSVPAAAAQTQPATAAQTGTDATAAATKPAATQPAAQSVAPRTRRKKGVSVTQPIAPAATQPPAPMAQSIATTRAQSAAPALAPAEIRPLRKKITPKRKQTDVPDKT